MEKIAVPLNIIANITVANQISKIDNAQLLNNVPGENNRQEINQSEVAEYEIDNYETVGEKYPYELFKKELQLNLSKNSKMNTRSC